MPQILFKKIVKLSAVWVLIAAGGFNSFAGFDDRAQSKSSSPLLTSALKNEIKNFTRTEIAEHFGAITTLNPPPDKIFGALTVGEFSWGSFMRALAAESDLGGTRQIAGKDTPRAVGEMGLVEARKGGKAFAQLYAALALRHYGTNLEQNAVWQSLNAAERAEWRSLLDPTRIYDAGTRRVINLPENYLGVAARIAAMSFEMGILSDRAFLDSIIERAAEQFTSGKIYADDNPPTGRYDRYSNEYVRYCWEAAAIAKRPDIQEKLKPSLRIQMSLWWDLVSDEGYGYNWGRSQGLVSYLDTLEIAAFLGENAEFRPASLADIASLYHLAWRWIRADYNDKTHLFRVFKFGRGNYSYINPEREWQQTGTAFGKIIVAHNALMRSLERENLIEIPVAPRLPQTARFEFFRRDEILKAGVWLVRQGKLQFALPITVGTKPAIADYLPAPFGLANFANPVEEVYPSLMPFVELSNGQIYAASDGADEIEPGENGQSLRVVSRRWAQIGGKSGERSDIGITSEVRWRIEQNRLIREETITSKNDLTIKKWRIAVPSAASQTRSETINKRRFDYFIGDQTTLGVAATADWKLQTFLLATGDSRLGKGTLGAVPLHLIYESENLRLQANKPRRWTLEMSVLSNPK